MYIHLFLASLALTTTFTLTACSSNDNDDPQPAGGSQFNPNGEPAVDDGQGGGDTTAIAGLWDGSMTEDDTSDVIYWQLDENGVLTRYDYQQDGALDASGENCYVVGDPISVSPEGDDSYSFFNVATTVTLDDETLTIAFIDPDINDLDADGDTSEIPTLSWTKLNTPVAEDLNACTTDETVETDATDENDGMGSADGVDETDLSEGTDTDSNADTPPTSDGETDIADNGGSDDIPFDNTGGIRPLMTRAECETIGGTIIGDIGNGAIHQPEYRCESGEPPVARITYLEGEPIATDGEVCCL